MEILGNGNIIGNESLCRRLYDDVTEGTLAHAYIIEGPEGSGRHTIAKNIIAALACDSLGKDNPTLPCKECKNCKDIFFDKCPDVMTYGKDGKASLGIESIRDLKETLPVVPNNLEFKAYILEDANTMTLQAQNAFLLTLEQPATRCYFFIICESARSLLETIRSRAPILRTEPIPTSDIADYICSEKVETTVSNAAKLLKNNQREEFDAVLVCADGSIGRAIELLSPKSRKPITDCRALAVKFINKLSESGRNGQSLTMFPEFSQKRDELVTQLEYIKNALRDLALIKKSESAPLLFFADRQKALDLSAMFSEKNLFVTYEKVNDNQEAVKKNANVRLTLINLLSNI